MEPPPVPRHDRLIVRLAMVAAFALTLALGSWHNDFPFVYHPDEPEKIEQVLTGRRNFHHPPFLLALTRAAAGGAATPAEVARTGRYISALALAGAAAALTWLAGAYGGAGGAVCAAAALSTDAQAILAGHYFKEDALFTLGFTLTLCAGAWHWRRRTVSTLLALGAAAGLALSAKYVGTLAVVLALILAWMAADRRARLAALGGCLLGAAAVFLALNGTALAGHLPEWRRGMVDGVEVMRRGNHTVGARVPHLAFVGMFFWYTPLPVLVGAAAFWAGLRTRPFRAYADRWLAGLSPLWLVAAFSFSASTAVRYYLPISLGLDCVAGAAWPGLARGVLDRWGRRRGRPMPGWLPALVGPGVLLLFTVPGAWTMVDGFGRDDRAALRLWITAHLPPTALIAEDALARLEEVPNPGDPKLSQPVWSRPAVADLGDAAALRARGVAAVVVCAFDSRRYFDQGKRPAAGVAADYERRSTFYRTLPQRATSAWKSELRQPYTLRPGLELYLLREPPAASRDAGGG